MSDEEINITIVPPSPTMSMSRPAVRPVCVCSSPDSTSTTVIKPGMYVVFANATEPNPSPRHIGLVTRSSLHVAGECSIQNITVNYASTVQPPVSVVAKHYLEIIPPIRDSSGRVPFWPSDDSFQWTTLGVLLTVTRVHGAETTYAIPDYELERVKDGMRDDCRELEEMSRNLGAEDIQQLQRLTFSTDHIPAEVWLDIREAPPDAMQRAFEFSA
ncbi:hypothetical protein EW146_g8491 [Bondarzewia mesenterica]|uniref:Uncharacterized protein n=1 Tax=Bondarzewia mesenterica TaxID=1095465 RepID=A0A4S4LEH5_9AGAM|nr:hypothetical protein EW146_g8491 [Bondarzewia mesenterica]